MDNPLVSIIIPCYNAAPWIGRAIQSALEQTYPEKEIIIIDDGSTDTSLDVIRSFGDRVRWETGPNRGGSAARNRGIELARGELIQFLDADDTIHPDKLTVQVPAALQFRPKVVYCDVEWFNVDGTRRVDVYKWPYSDAVELMLLGYTLVGCPLHWKACLEAVGGFRVGLPSCQEWDLHLRLACEGVQFHRLEGVFYTYNRHSGSVSGNHQRSTQTRVAAAQDCYARLLRNGTLTDARARAFALCMAQWGLSMLEYGLPNAAAECFARAREMHRSGGITANYGDWVVRTIHRICGPCAVLKFHKWRRRVGVVIRCNFPRFAQWIRPVPSS